MRIGRVRTAFAEAKLRASAYQTQRHCFRYLADLFDDIAKHPSDLLGVLQKIKEPHTRAALANDETEAAGTGKWLSGAKRKAATAPPVEPPAKRRRPQLKIPESKEGAAEEAQFVCADLYARDWDRLDFAIDFLASGIDMACLAIYNTIMAPFVGHHHLI